MLIHLNANIHNFTSLCAYCVSACKCYHIHTFTIQQYRVHVDSIHIFALIFTYSQSNDIVCTMSW